MENKYLQRMLMKGSNRQEKSKVEVIVQQLVVDHEVKGRSQVRRQEDSHLNRNVSTK